MLFNKMTDKNEIITLSSDEEEEFENLPQVSFFYFCTKKSDMKYIFSGLFKNIKLIIGN